MTTTPHPDTLTDWQAFKELKRGGRQAADDQAMAAMWQALESGRSREEANKVFNDTYKKVIHGNRRKDKKAQA